MIRIGLGYDLHTLVEGRPLILGGVHIPFEKGEAGHSDGDVLLHALADSLLGAACLGDIGELFPPNDPQWNNSAVPRGNPPVYCGNSIGRNRSNFCQSKNR